MYLPTFTKVRKTQFPGKGWRRVTVLVAIFVATFFLSLWFLKPINSQDYWTWVRALRAFLEGHSPYSIEGFFLPPWFLPVLLPIALQPLEVWLALTVALFVTMIIDLGKPSGLLLLLHPAFITLFASANGEWLLVGPGLWLLYRCQRGWGRGLAWLLLACKPQSTIVLLLLEGYDALRTRDWKAFLISGVVAAISLALYPDFFVNLETSHHVLSLSTVAHYGIIGAALVTLFIVAVRWQRRYDLRSLGLLLSPVWTPYTLQYSYTTMMFTMRSAGLIRNVLYVIAGIVLAILFWQEHKTVEYIGALGMVLLAAIMAPSYEKPSLPKSNSPSSPDSSRTESDKAVSEGTAKA